MGGIWSNNPLPIRSGAYINFESSGDAPVEPGTFGRVGMPIRASWGPENQFVDIVTDADRLAVFGNVDGDVSSTEDTSWLIREAIIGGAELVKAYRLVGAGAQAASGILVDAASDTILTVSAKYQGTRANLFRVRVAQNTLFAYRQDLIVEELSGSAYSEIEKWTFDTDDVSRLVDRVNDPNTGSSFIVLGLDATAAAAINEVQRLTATPDRASDGNYRLQFFDGSTSQITGDIAWNASPADVQTALAALANIGAGNVAVAGDNFSESTIGITRDGTVAGAGETARIDISINGAPVVTTADIVEGAGVGVSDGDGIAAAMTAAAAGPVFTCTAGNAVDIGAAGTVYAFSVDRENIVLTFDNTVGASPMSVGSGADAVAGAQANPAAPSTMDITFQGALAGQDVFDLTVAGASGTALVGGPIVASTVTTGSPTQNEIQEIDVTTGLAVGETLSLTFDDGTGARTTSALASTAGAAAIQLALESLSNVGVGNVVVTQTAGGATLGAVSTYQVRFTGALTGQDFGLMVATIGNPVPTGVVAINAVTDGQPDALAVQSIILTGGSNGAAATLQSYTDAMAAFEAEGGFDLFAFDGISEEDFTGLNSAVKVWADNNNDAGRYVMVVMGGGTTELANAGGAGVATALGRSALFDTEWVVNLGVSGLKVDSPAGNELLMTSAQSAPRLAGMIASAGITGSVTFSAAVGASGVNSPLTPSQIEVLIQEGVTAWAKRGDVVRLEDGITSFVSVTEEKDFTFTQIRAVRAIQQIGTDISEIVETDWIGKMVNTTSVRDSLVARLEQYFAALEAQRVLVNGTQVQIDTRFDNTKTNVFVLVLAQFQFELKRVLLTIRVPTVS